MDDARPVAEAALVRRGRIALVGTNGEVLAARRNEPPFDAGGRTVVPGFIDGHAHLEMTCLALTRCVSCTAPPYASLAEIAGELSRVAERTPPDEWIIGRSSFGLHLRVPEGRLFTRQELDAVSEQHPIVVHSSLHVGMLNTRALHELGLWEQAADPPRGIVLHRDERGLPTGVVTEMWDMLPAFETEDVKTALRAKAHELFVANGVTTVHNLPYSNDDVRAVQELQASGELPLRIRFYPQAGHQLELEETLALGIQPGFGNDLLRYGGVKIFIDGTCHDGYGNRLWDVKWDQEELTEFVCRAHAAGQQLWMHINCVPSILMGANAIEEALRRHPRPHRHRLEHSADFAEGPEEIARLKGLGIGVVTTPQFIYSQGDTMGNRYSRSFRLRTLIAAGFEVIGTSDSTGTVPDGVTPLFNIACAVTRRTQRGREFLPEEAVTIEDALKMFTIWPAKWAFEEHDKGSIVPGKLADFAVLSADPLTLNDPAKLFDLKVDATILGGEVVYQR
jgi:hypothetical protein